MRKPKLRLVQVQNCGQNLEKHRRLQNIMQRLNIPQKAEPGHGTKRLRSDIGTLEFLLDTQRH